MNFLHTLFKRVKRKLFPPENCLSGYWSRGLKIAGDQFYGTAMTDVGNGYEIKSKWNPGFSVDVTLLKNKVRICEVNFYRVYGGSRTGKVSTWPEFADMDEYDMQEDGLGYSRGRKNKRRQGETKLSKRRGDRI